ncbi:MAG: hypothetical protein ACPGJS_01715 [Flammeovirgaceae bacterium]
MTRKEQLAYCSVCHNRKMSQQGLICSITAAKATFQSACESFDLDQAERVRRAQRDLEVERSSDGDFFEMGEKGFKAGVSGGIVMIVIAVVWFGGGLTVDRIFFYPPVLFLIGLVALVKGLVDSNGKKHEYRKH